MRALWLTAYCSFAALRLRDTGTQLKELKGGPLSPPVLNPFLPVTNPYAPSIPTGVVEELYPVAPKDALSPPGDGGPFIYGPLDRSKVVDQLAWRSAFPGETPGTVPGLAGRTLVAQPDRVEVPIPKSAQNESPGAESFQIDPPVANAPEDKIPAEFSRYFNQQYHKEGARKFEARLEDEMLRADVNGDGGITNEEFQLELKDRQHRSQDEINKLFDKYKDRNNVITKQNFKRLAATGYEPLNMVKLPLSESVADPAAGYWGTAFQCPPKTIAVGARTKVLPYKAGADNTVLNGVEILCGTLEPGGNTKDGVVAGWEQGDMFQSAEGPDGSWSAAKTCPEGQAIDGMRVRKLPYLSTQDNTGLTNVTFNCRSKTLLDSGAVGFSVAEPSGAAMGGWEAPQTCPTGQFICKMQTRADPYGADKMGLTVLSFACCGGYADCGVDGSSGVCQNKDSKECKMCREAETMR
jgi:hypothetical protein